MFSGLIAYIGRVAFVEPVVGGGLRLRVRAREAMREGIAPKDSIAINGVCLTAVAVDDADVTFDVVPETVSRSTLASMRVGDSVNVELSLRVGDRWGVIWSTRTRTQPLRFSAISRKGKAGACGSNARPSLRRTSSKRGTSPSTA